MVGQPVASRQMHTQQPGVNLDQCWWAVGSFGKRGAAQKNKNLETSESLRSGQNGNINYCQRLCNFQHAPSVHLDNRKQT